MVCQVCLEELKWPAQSLNLNLIKQLFWVICHQMCHWDTVSQYIVHRTNWLCTLNNSKGHGQSCHFAVCSILKWLGWLCFSIINVIWAEETAVLVQWAHNPQIVATQTILIIITLFYNKGIQACNIWLYYSFPCHNIIKILSKSISPDFWQFHLFWRIAFLQPKPEHQGEKWDIYRYQFNWILFVNLCWVSISCYHWQKKHQLSNEATNTLTHTIPLPPSWQAFVFNWISTIRNYIEGALIKLVRSLK